MVRNNIYKYDCFITMLTNFGLFDGNDELRCTSPDLEGVVQRKIELGWGTIRRLKLLKDGIKFGEVIE